MKIETKFNIHDLVIHKFQKLAKRDGLILAFEVIDVATVTCIAGTQVFYDCRKLFGMWSNDYATDDSVKKLIDVIADSLDTGKSQSVRFREDEVVELPKEFSDMVKSQNSPDK